MMYTMALTYKENGQDAVMVAEVVECFTHASANGQHCNMVLATADQQEIFETMACNNVEVVRLTLSENEQVVYTSTYWHRVQSVNGAFHANGEKRCDVSFSHIHDHA